MLWNMALVRTDVSEALSSSETSVLTRATRRNISEDAILHSRRRENFKSYIYPMLWELILRLEIAGQNISSCKEFLKIKIIKHKIWNIHNNFIYKSTATKDSFVPKDSPEKSAVLIMSLILLDIIFLLHVIYRVSDNVSKWITKIAFPKTKLYSQMHIEVGTMCAKRIKSHNTAETQQIPIIMILSAIRYRMQDTWYTQFLPPKYLWNYGKMFYEKQENCEHLVQQTNTSELLRAATEISTSLKFYSVHHLVHI
jgi:hypothetical protein